MANHAVNSEQSIREVDVAVIGAGTAGINAFKQVLKSTKNAVMINNGFWTTTCVMAGCMPSKLLIAAAERAHHANHSTEFGILGNGFIDGKQVMKRVQTERDRFASFIQQEVNSWDSENKLEGIATIIKSGVISVAPTVNKKIIEAEPQYIKAKHIIIATGSTPFVPENWVQNLGNKLLTSDTIFQLQDLPKSIAIIGSGAIGLELAQALHRLGVKVSVFNRSQQIAGIKDDEINTQTIDSLTRELDLRLGTSITAVKADDEKAYIEYKDNDGSTQNWQGDFVLVATGRRNTIDKLGLEHLGVQLDNKNRPLNMDKLSGHIKDTNVYIVGDANAQQPLMHVASDEGYHAGNAIRHVLENSKKTASLVAQAQLATPLAVIFTEPQIASTGLSLTELEKDLGKAFVVGEVSFANQGRSRIMGVNSGLLRIYASPETGEILGASMVGPDAEYIMHILATAITNKLTVEQLLVSPFYHPTILEGLRTALRNTNNKIKRAKIS